MRQNVAFALTIVALTAAAAVAAPAPGTASPATTADPNTNAKPTAAPTCVVMLECGTYSQKTKTDASGKFTFNEVPTGTCTVSVLGAQTEFGAGSYASSSSVTSPRDAASGQATGKRQHKPYAYSVSVNGYPAASAASRTATVDAAPPSASYSFVVQERKKELTGHVTLMK